jgi:hypothetical protein
MGLIGLGMKHIKTSIAYLTPILTSKDHTNFFGVFTEMEDFVTTVVLAIVLLR